MSDRDNRRPNRHANDPDIEIANLRQAITRWREILSLAIPDTFLGRPRHEEKNLRWYQYDNRHRQKTDGSLAGGTASPPPRPAKNGMSIADALGVLVRTAIEQTAGKARAAFYAANSQRTALHHVTGMTEEYARFVDGFAISPHSLACGLAAATRRAVITPDVMQESSWSRWRWLAKEFDYRVCWSFPIETRQGELVGTFAMYHREPTEAKQRDLEFVSVLTRTAARIMSETFTEY